MASDLIHHVTDSSFDADVLKSDMPVLVDYWAEWCGPCKAIAPVLDEIAHEYQGKLKIAKVNVDENTFIASQFQVRSIPTVYAIFQGQPIADLSPARTEPQLKQMLDQLLEKLPISAGPVTDDPTAALLPLMELSLIHI